MSIRIESGVVFNAEEIKALSWCNTHSATLARLEFLPGALMEEIVGYQTERWSLEGAFNAALAGDSEALMRAYRAFYLRA